MKVPLLDLKPQYLALRDELDEAVRAVIESQYFVLGPTVSACEEAIAAYCSCAHGVGVSSGTDALLSALMAECIGPGSEVITTPYTFFATVGCIVRVGARPVLVDIDPVTFNLRADQVADALTDRTRAILPVHLYGQMADMEALEAGVRDRAIPLIEDAAQAIGAEQQGRRAGSVGRYGCLSFYPSKNLPGYGDGGMVVTNDASAAERVRRLRNHGMEPKYHHHWVGGNFRLDAIQAAVLTVKLRHLDEWTARRQANADRYDRYFREAGLTPGPIQTPRRPAAQSGDRHVCNQYVIRADRRDDLRAYLTEHGVATEIYYPVPLHLQPCFRSLGHRPGDFPASEQAARETLALPIYPELSAEQAEYVVSCIGRFYAG